GNPEPGGAEECHPRLVHDCERDRRNGTRLVAHDVGRIDSGELRDQREEGMPEREGVAGVQAAVAELVDRSDVQVAELDELPYATEVEERVAVDRGCDVPQQGADDDTAERD